MHSVETNGIRDAVADTLFIPLYMRCLETRRRDARIIDDPEACRVVNMVDYDFSKYDGALRSQVGTCIRVRHFDEVTRRFLDQYENPVVVSLGCGLDNRSKRIGGDKGVFYNMDLPEVMALRDKLILPDERNISMHESMFEDSWAASIRKKHPDGSFLVLAEGVFMYFAEEEVRPVLERIARTLAPGELLFDACTSFGCKTSSSHDTVKYTNASFKWGLDDDRLPELWTGNLTLLDTAYFMNKEKKRWGWTTRIVTMIPAMARAFRMLHYRIDAPAAG